MRVGAGRLWEGLRIGVLGGSFNPAHEGHRHVSLVALHRLRLDFVVWLVSPANPLKPSRDLPPLRQRLAQARALTRHPRLMVSDLEHQLGTRYTLDTLRALRRRFPGTHWVWLMGADNLAQMPRWHRWQEIFHLAPIAIVDRPTYSLRARGGLAAVRFARYRLTGDEVVGLAGRRAPAWAFLHCRHHRASSTALRQSGPHPSGSRDKPRRASDAPTY